MTNNTIHGAILWLLTYIGDSPTSGDFPKWVLKRVKGRTIIFFDGPIGAGKSTCLEGVNDGGRHYPGIVDLTSNDEWIILPAPIEEIRAITAELYAGKIPLGEVSHRIADMCMKQWKTAALEHPTKNIAVEHLPPPFHTWIFDPRYDYRTSLSVETEKKVQKWDKASPEERENMKSEYWSKNHIVDALGCHEELAAFDTVIAAIVMNDPESLRKNILKRGRPEESELGPEFLGYLLSKFQLALWEHDEHCLAGVHIEDMEQLIRMFPH